MLGAVNKSFMLNVIMLSVVVLKVMAPHKQGFQK